MNIVVGLGNPGTEYESTRHNTGFMVVERLAQARGIVLDKKTRLVRWGEGDVGGIPVTIAESRTFMNNSGLAVKELLKAADADPEKLIVVYDDLDLEPGQIRVRENGGSGGHKGIISIVNQIGSDVFVRVRVGIGRPPGRQDPARYVLSPFSKREREDMDVTIERAADAVAYLLLEGVTKAMNEFNRRIDQDD
ncbi:MAG: aminoacyl-tRNA hydrolase [Candidatus Aquicultor primus]|uniref:Peptidyl-tRNA hydrolase n=1 Tax=Candidatus Aquicultor primus TaxID=1797195 RepID=A0A1F2UQV1_9ACTN|nr:MAG: aminoacyl-tRNA hydrolase [Candidatus Aquicultor primus]HCG99491.1 aminoacyl-tRNA hydrolase [Actinomycetota bacterium]